jgi:hypothetical protein
MAVADWTRPCNALANPEAVALLAEKVDSLLQY